MGSVLIERKNAKQIDKIFEHPDDVYSIYLKNGEVIWVDGKIELYKTIRELV